MTNLAGNAVKFTDSGCIRIDAAVVERYPGAVLVEVSVRDTGIGIPANQLGTIFEEFTLASPEIMSKFGGTSLGLAISQKLMQLFGSDISVESTPGEGSTFSFRLRLEEASSPSDGS